MYICLYVDIYIHTYIFLHTYTHTHTITSITKQLRTTGAELNMQRTKGTADRKCTDSRRSALTVLTRSFPRFRSAKVNFFVAPASPWNNKQNQQINTSWLKGAEVKRSRVSILRYLRRPCTSWLGNTAWPVLCCSVYNLEDERTKKKNQTSRHFLTQVLFCKNSSFTQHTCTFFSVRIETRVEAPLLTDAGHLQDVELAHASLTLQVERGKV